MSIQTLAMVCLLISNAAWIWAALAWRAACRREAAQLLASRDVTRKWRAANPTGKDFTLHILEIALGLPSPWTTKELQDAYERDARG